MSDYQAAVDASKALQNAAMQASTSPPISISEALVEETFGLFSKILTGGLDEESLTASFMVSLLSAHRFWTHNWLWGEVNPSDSLWAQFNKKSETELGVDFVLAIAAADGFVVTIAQAKNYSVGDSDLDIGRRASRGAYKEATKDFRTIADPSLLEVLINRKLTSTVDDQEWQLTRFLLLKKAIELIPNKVVGAPHLLYVCWPDSDGSVLYEELDSVAKKISGVPGGLTSPIKQSFKLDHKKLFKEFLCEKVKDGSTAMPFRDTQAVLEHLKGKAHTMIVVDVTGHGLGNSLAAAIDLPVIKPAAPAGVTHIIPKGP